MPSTSKCYGNAPHPGSGHRRLDKGTLTEVMRAQIIEALPRHPAAPHRPGRPAIDGRNARDHVHSRVPSLPVHGRHQCGPLLPFAHSQPATLVWLCVRRRNV